MLKKVSRKAKPTKEGGDIEINAETNIGAKYQCVIKLLVIRGVLTGHLVSLLGWIVDCF